MNQTGEDASLEREAASKTNRSMKGSLEYEDKEPVADTSLRLTLGSGVGAPAEH